MTNLKNQHKQESKQEKILNLFFTHPSKTFHIREIARKIDVHPNLVSKEVNRLVRENFLVKKKTKLRIEIEANRENKRFIFYKRLSNIKKIFDSGLLNYLIEKFNHPDAIILYGSYSKGEDSERSDIDIAVISKRKEKLDMSIYENKLNKATHVLVVDLNKVEKTLINNLINGVILYGYLAIK